MVQTYKYFVRISNLFQKFSSETEGRGKFMTTRKLIFYVKYKSEALPLKVKWLM